MKYTALALSLLVLSACAVAPKENPKYKDFSCEEIAIQHKAISDKITQYQVEANVQTGMAVLGVLSMVAGGGNTQYSTDYETTYKQAQFDLQHLENLSQEKNCPPLPKKVEEPKTKQKENIQKI